MGYEYLDIDLNAFIEKLQNFKLTEMNNFNGLLGDLTNYIYDTFEKLENADISTEEKSKVVIEKLKILQPQVVKLNIILDKLYQNFDDKYMCRLVNISFPLEKVIEQKINNL